MGNTFPDVHTRSSPGRGAMLLLGVRSRSPDMAVVFAHVRQAWGNTAGVAAHGFWEAVATAAATAATATTAATTAAATAAAAYSRSSTNTAGPSAPGGGRSAPVLCPGSVGAMLTRADGRTHAHWLPRRNATVYGNLRRMSAKAAPPSPPWPSGGQCRATSSHTPASAAHAVASWRVRRLCVLQCARRG